MCWTARGLKQRRFTPVYRHRRAADCAHLGVVWAVGERRDVSLAGAQGERGHRITATSMIQSASEGDAMIAGCGLVLLGWAMRMIVDRRRFYRRNPMGLQEFPSYWSALVCTGAEEGLHLLGGIVRSSGVVLLVF